MTFPHFDSRSAARGSGVSLLCALSLWLGCQLPASAASSEARAAAAAGASRTGAAPSASAAAESASPTRPSPAPKSPPAAPVSPSGAPDYELADLDPDNDRVVGPPEPLPECEAKLKRAGISFRAASLPLKTERARGAEIISCGAEQVVSYRGGPAKIRYSSWPTLTCRMALALSRWEQVLQEQAQLELGQRVTRLTQGGTYNCRKMVRFDFVSEHSYGNAIDIRDLTLADGRRLTVARHFGALTAPPQTREARFLRRVAERAFDERLFSVVLTPYWDRLHHDHFHLDLARYHVDGTRPQP